MTLAALLVAAERGLGDVGAKPLGQRTIMRSPRLELGAVWLDLGIEARRAHACGDPVCRKQSSGPGLAAPGTLAKRERASQRVLRLQLTDEFYRWSARRFCSPL